MTSALELFANTVTTAAIVLAARNSVHTWWTGIIGSVLFSLLFHRSQLYAEVVLQVFFIGTSALGWWQWLHGDRGQQLEVTRAPARMFAWVMPVSIACAAGYGALLHAWTDAYAPFVDAAVLVLSVVAQLLLMRRCLQSWWFWLAVNTIAVPLYVSRGLHLTALLYVAYWINAVIALRHWRRLANGEAGVEAVPSHV